MGQADPVQPGGPEIRFWNFTLRNERGGAFYRTCLGSETVNGMQDKGRLRVAPEEKRLKKFNSSKQWTSPDEILDLGRNGCEGDVGPMDETELWTVD